MATKSMHPDPDDELLTLTHARLRVRNGDYCGAARVLRRILEREPSDAEARALLRSIAGRSADSTAEAEEPPLEPPRAGDPGRLAGEFRRTFAGTTVSAAERARRLEDWLVKIRRSR